MTLNLHSHPKPRRLSPCHRHPQQPLTPLCAPCLRERLSLLNPSSSSSSTSTSATATATASSSSSSAASAAVPELRRCKTFSADKCQSLGSAVSYEPRRRSCEVRARSTLEDLFTFDDDQGHGAASTSKSKVESINLGLLGGTYPVPELIELREEEEDDSDCEIRVSADAIVANADEGTEDSKTMKEFIDLELERSKPGTKDFKEIAGSFWIAASVFSRKLQKWKRKQKSERPPQSEVGDSGFGRRSCDTDPRVSIDLGRASIDGSRISVDGIGKRFFDTDPRYSLDLARASVDCSGLLSMEPKQRSFDPHRATTPVVSVIENAMATVYGFNKGSLVAEKPRAETEIVHDTKLLITEKELMSSRMKSRSIRVDAKPSKDPNCSDRTSSKKSINWGKLLIFRRGFLGGQKQQKSGVDDGDKLRGRG